MGYDCLLDFTAFSQLIRHASLSIRFLFVRLRFRYCFFSPTSHDVKLASRFGVRRQLRPLWTFTTDWRHARHTKKHTFFGYNQTLGPLTWAAVNPYFIQDCSHRTISNARNLRFHQPRSLWVKQNILLYLFNDLRKLYHTWLTLQSIYYHFSQNSLSACIAWFHTHCLT